MNCLGLLQGKLIQVLLPRKHARSHTLTEHHGTDHETCGGLCNFGGSESLDGPLFAESAAVHDMYLCFNPGEHWQATAYPFSRGYRLLQRPNSRLFSPRLCSSCYFGNFLDKRDLPFFAQSL